MLSMKKNSNTKFGIKFMGVMLGMMLAVPAFASIAVAPTRIEVNANKIRGNYLTTAIDIKGDATQAMRFKAYPGYFIVDSNGKAILKDSSDDKYDISKKIRFVPSEFTVAPNRGQKLRINVANIKALPDGENRAMLYIEDVNPKEMNIPTGQSGIGAQLIVKTRVGVPIYIDKGNFTKKADIEYANIQKENDGYYLNMKVVSTGNSRVRYSTKVQFIQNKKLIDEQTYTGSLVGANNSYVDKQKLDLSNIKESGEYTARIIISYFDEKDKHQYVKKETSINIIGKM